MKLRNDNAFFVFQRIPLKYIFFLKDNLCEFHLREQFFCRNTLINPVLIVRKLQYDYHAFLKPMFLALSREPKSAFLYLSQFILFCLRLTPLQENFLTPSSFSELRSGFASVISEITFTCKSYHSFSLEFCFK